MKTVKIFWLSLSLAYWALLPQFYLVYDQGNRYSLSWTYGSYLAILAAILTVGGVFFLVAASVLWVAKRYSGLNHFIRNVLGGVAGAIFLRSIFSLLDKGDVLPAQWQGVVDLRTVKLGIYLLPFLGLTVCKQVAMNLLRIVSLGVTVLLVLFLLLPWFWPTYGWDEKVSSISTEEYTAATNSIYIFIFDEWSFDHTLAHTEKLSQLPTLSALLSEADLFTKAQSCGAETPIAIPRFLFQPDAEMQQLHYQEVRKSVIHNWLVSRNYLSIFDLSTNHFKSLLGYYLYYPSIVGPKVDYCGTFTEKTEATRYRDNLVTLLASQVAFLQHLGLSLPTRNTMEGKFIEDNYEVQHNTRSAIKNLLLQLPDMNISFIHLCFPHGPYQYNQDGTRLNNPVGDGEPDVDVYWMNIAYMDLIVGDIVSALKQRGDYEQSLLVLTSDHSWRYAPGLKHVRDAGAQALEKDDLLPFSYTRHVPLIIKHPGQTTPRTYEQVVSCWDLHHLFSQYLEHPSKTMDFKWWTDEHLPSGQRILPVSAGGE